MAVAQALEVQTLFRGVVIGTKHIVRAHRKRRDRTFVIGQAARADAPVAAHDLAAAGHGGDGDDDDGDDDGGGDDDGDATHTLVTADDDYTVHVTPRMSGVVVSAQRTVMLRDRVGAHGGRFVLGRGERARIECGAVTFLLATTDRAPTIGAPPVAWRSAAHRYHLVTALGLAVLLLALRTVPEDPRALSLDLFARERGLVKFVIKPSMPPPSDDTRNAAINPAPAGGRRGQAAGAPSGAAGDRTAHARDRRYAIQGRADNPAVRAGAQPTVARPDQAGLLGVLQRSDAARGIFARESAFGRDAETVLGQLVADSIGNAYGEGGLGALGSGSGGGGTGGPVLGFGGLMTVGDVGGGGRPDGRRYGQSIGHLGTRVTRAPDIIPGRVQVLGSLDREIVRRVIRRRINEVKFCYEQELARDGALSGRVEVQFTITATGQVLTSVLQNSTLGNARAENCIVQAVRRWEFPRPAGGGLVVVSYPFVLTPAAGLGR